MKTDELIQKLATDLKPAKPMASVLRATVFFGLGDLMLIVLSFFLMKVRGDLSEQLNHARFWFEAVSLLILGFLALSLSILLSRPGREVVARRFEKLTLTVFLAVALYEFSQAIGLNREQVALGLNLAGAECLLTVLAYAIMLGGGLLYWLRKGASAQPRLTGLAVAVASVALGSFAISFFCAIENGIHILVWHFALPSLIVAALGWLAGRAWLRW